jgi:ferredoxin
MPERVRIERDLCLGAGYCAAIAPATFALGDDEIATVLDARAASDEELQEAEITCPAGAIFLDHAA